MGRSGGAVTVPGAAVVRAYALTGADYGTVVWTERHDSILWLTLEGERIATTAEHPFYTRQRGWVAAGDLRVGESVRRDLPDSAVRQRGAEHARVPGRGEQPHHLGGPQRPCRRDAAGAVRDEPGHGGGDGGLRRDGRGGAGGRGLAGLPGPRHGVRARPGLRRAAGAGGDPDHRAQPADQRNPGGLAEILRW
jgi:hypothetical protein